MVTEIKTSWGNITGNFTTDKMFRMRITPFYDNSITFLDDKSINYHRHHKPFTKCLQEDAVTGKINFIFRSNSLLWQDYKYKNYFIPKSLTDIKYFHSNPSEPTHHITINVCSYKYDNADANKITGFKKLLSESSKPYESNLDNSNKYLVYYSIPKSRYISIHPLLKKIAFVKEHNYDLLYYLGFNRKNKSLLNLTEFQERIYFPEFVNCESGSDYWIKKSDENDIVLWQKDFY